jgi:hypothetical protein
MDRWPKPSRKRAAALLQQSEQQRQYWWRATGTLSANMLMTALTIGLPRSCVALDLRSRL